MTHFHVFTVISTHSYQNNLTVTPGLSHEAGLIGYLAI